jgi:anaerobic magnesium-protoporphyrin IX monomethyl ester cyclase
VNAILLVFPKIREWARPCNIPLGVLYTSAVLKQVGIKPVVLDDNQLRWSDSRIRKFLSENKFDLVGVSAVVHQYSQVKRWVELVRETQQGQPIIVGGPISVLGEKLVSWLGVGVWQGESEVGFPEAVLSGAVATRKVHSSPRSMDALDALPFPDWDSVDMVSYANAPVGWVNKRKWKDGEAVDPNMPRSMNLLAARGCPHKCAFCAHDFMGKKFRVRSPGNILREMLELRERWAVKYFHLSDDNTLSSPSWVYKFCDAKDKHLVLKDATWGCAGRADACNPEMLKRMYDSGCRIVGVGIESSSQRILDAMNKRTTVSENEKAILACKRVFGEANYSLIVGSPGETDQDIQASIDLCKRTETRPEVVFVATPIPGAAWYESALAKGLIKDEQAYLENLGENKNLNCNISGQSDEWVLAAQARIVEETKMFGGAI